MSPRTPSQQWEERPLENEDEEFAKILGTIVDRIHVTATKAKDKPRRGFHAKIHAGVMGEFKVLPDVPEEAKFGLFATPAVYPMFVRFSNGQSDLQPDTNAQPRGIALKLVGVPGSPDERLDEAKNAVTQDFLATSHSLTSIVRNAVQFFAVLDVLEGNEGDGLLKKISTVIKHPFEAARIAFRLRKDVILPRVDSMATEYFSGTAPIQCGHYAIKFLIHPPLDVTAVQHENHKDYLRRELDSRLKSGDIHFDFSVQFFIDSEHTPIEDTSIEWAEHYSPFHKVAELRIPKCEIESPLGTDLTDLVDQLSFSPWHGLKMHRPLGNVMRARRLAYPMSSGIRTFLAEPTRTEGGAPLAEGGTAESLRATVHVASS